jgi:hypothetical protein
VYFVFIVFFWECARTLHRRRRRHFFSGCDKQFELIHHEIIDLEEAAMSARRAKY